MFMKRMQVILPVALCTASVAFSAALTLAQNGSGSEPGSYQVPVVEQVEREDKPSADAARGNAEAAIPGAGAPSQPDQPSADSPPDAEQPPLEP
jgi:hypothetical protein